MEPILHIAKNESDYALRIIPIEFVFLPVLYAKHVKVVRARAGAQTTGRATHAPARNRPSLDTHTTRALSRREIHGSKLTRQEGLPRDPGPLCAVVGLRVGRAVGRAPLA